MEKPPTPQELGPFQLILLALSLLVLAMLGAEMAWDLPAETSRVIRWMDGLVCALLFIDFLVRFRRAESKSDFMKWGWLDLVASVPVVDSLRWARLFRVIRLFRLLRAAKSLRGLFAHLFGESTGHGLAPVLATTVLVLALSSAGILLVEHAPDSNIRTAGDALWWSVSTVTTVGYGDRYPVTREGRFIAAALMITGVGIFGALSGAIASFFLGAKREAGPDHAAILARLDALQDEVRRLRARPPASDE